MVGRNPTSSKPGLPQVTAKAALLVDHRGRVLFEKNSDMRLPTASTQKLLLGILIADSGNLDQPITVSSSDTQCEPTKLGIQPGQTYRKGDLLKVVLVRSSNDVARCLARNHSGSVSAFASAMNSKARQLGMRNSYFTNASGLPSPAGQYSTAKDLAILANAAMKRQVIREAVRTRGMIFQFSNGTTQTVYNTNQVLRGNPYCNGCKTGYTREAGRCLVSSASDGRKSVIAVVLGSKTPNVWNESDGLLRYGLWR
jgi:D-alanyl-D-alanine carboxypeptidase (penicillin-binding protein 5/6)